MKGVKNVDKIKDEIKDTVAKYIEKRLIVSRELQSMRYSKEELFDLDVYITLDMQYENLLGSLYEKHKNGEEETVLEKDGKQVLMYDAVKALRKNLHNEKVWKAQFSDNNIKDIVDLIKRYFDIIDLFEFGKIAEVTNENFFLRGILYYIRDNDVKEYSDKADRYMKFFYAQERAGFNTTIGGRISIGYGNLIDITNIDNRTIFKVSSDHKVSVHYNEEKDYFLMGRDIFFGLQIINDKETLIPVRKINRDGKITYNPFIYGDYELEEADEICEDKIYIYYSLSNLLKAADLESYYENVYNMYDFTQLMDFVRSALMIDEEKRISIDNVADVAADWWISVVSSPELKAGLEGTNGIYIEYAEEKRAKDNLDGAFTNDKVKVFKETLKETIKKLLIIQGFARLSVDYGPDYELSKCAEKAGVSGFICFPWKTVMNVDLDEVTVKYGYGAKELSIFKRETDLQNEETVKEKIKKEL